jgi:flagellar motor component MotA
VNMKLIVFIIILAAILLNGGKAINFVSEPVALILIGTCLIGLAQIGRTKFKNKEYKYNWQTFMLLVGNTLFKNQVKTK